MDNMVEILNLPSVNKVQVIEDLLWEIRNLRAKLEGAVNIRSRLCEEHREAMDEINENHNEELQKHMDKHAETLSLIQQMDEIAAENTIMVKCRKCDCHYKLPVDLSEFDPEYSYCGKGGPSPCTP